MGSSWKRTRATTHGRVSRGRADALWVPLEHDGRGALRTRDPSQHDAIKGVQLTPRELLAAAVGTPHRPAVDRKPPRLKVFHRGSDARFHRIDEFAHVRSR